MSTHVHSTWSRSQSPFLISFRPWSNIGTAKFQHSQAQPYGKCTRVIDLTQTHYIIWNRTEKQLATFLKSLKLLGLWWIRNLDLPNSKQMLYHYTIDYDYICQSESIHFFFTKHNQIFFHPKVKILLCNSIITKHLLEILLVTNKKGKVKTIHIW